MVEVNNNSSVPQLESEVFDPERFKADIRTGRGWYEERDLEKNAELLDMDVEGAYRSLVNEKNLNSIEALKAIKKKVLSSMGEDPRFNLDSEALDTINKTLSPNQVLLKYTNIRDRGGIEAFLEGATQSAVVNSPAFAGGIAAGLKVGRAINKLPIPNPLVKYGATAIGGTAAALATMAGVTTVMQSVWDKVVKDTPFQNDPFLPQDYGPREGGKTVGAFLGGGAAARPFLKNIAPGGSDFFVKKASGGIEEVAKAINPIKESFRVRAMNTARRAGKRINLFDGTFWKKMTKNIGDSARDTTTKNVLGLTPYTAAETLASVGAGVAAVSAEKVWPGKLLPRILAETAGGFLQITYPLAKAGFELGKDAVSGMQFIIPEKIFGMSTGQAVQRAKDRKVGATFLKMLKGSFDEAGEVFDAEKFTADIRKNFSLEELKRYNNNPEARSMGFLTNNDALIALQNTFAQESPEFRALLTNEIVDQTEIITATVRTLYGTENPDAIKAATELFSTTFGSRVEAALNIAVNKIDPLVDSVKGRAQGFETRTEATEALRASILEVYEGADNVVDGLWKRVDRSVEASPRNALDAVERAFDPTRGGGNKQRFVYQEGPKIGKWDPGKFGSTSLVPILKRLEQAGSRVKYKDWADLTPEEKIKFKNEPNVNKGQGGPRRVKVDSGYNSMILNEMKNDRTTLMAEAKALPQGAKAERALMLSIAEGLMEDMMGAVVVNKANKAAFERARGASMIVRDIFDRTFAKTVINQDEPMLLRLNTALGSGKDKGRVLFEEVEDAADILFTLGKEFGPRAAGRTTIGGVETTLEDLGARANASVESVAAGLLGSIFNAKNVFKTVNVDLPRLPGQPKRTETIEVVDKKVLEKILADPMVERILGFEAFKSLRNDLESADNLTYKLLKKALPELERQAARTEVNTRLLANVLNIENPQQQINRVLDSGEPLAQFKALSKMVADADAAQPDAKVKKAFLATLVDTLITRAAIGEKTADISAFRRSLEEPIIQLRNVEGGAPVSANNNQDSIKKVLQENNLMDKKFFGRLDTLYKGFEDLTKYSTKVVDTAAKEVNETTRFLASILGAASAPSTKTGSIAVPAAAARLARSALADTPQVLLYARIKELLSPGNSEAFIRALELGQDAIAGVDAREVIARQLANYLQSGSLVFATGVARETSEEFREEKPAPVRPERKPAPVRPEPKPSVDTSSLISPRPPITQPLSKQAAAVDLSGPFNPETYARLFPNDGVA